MNRKVLLAASVMLTALVLSGCPQPNPVDSGPGDTGSNPADTGADSGNNGGDASDARADVRADVRVDAGTSMAGNACTDDTMCGGLTCDTMVPGGMCTQDCENGSAATERTMCGGAGSTCLQIGDGTTSAAQCTRQCMTAGATSGCRMNQVCTGWWYTHMAGADNPAGCSFFCHSDAECPGAHCSRFGTCAAAVPPMTRAPDGAPCNPMLDPMGVAMPSTQCRGICFRTDSAAPTHGICGSRVDVRQPPTPLDDTMCAAGAPCGGCPDGDLLVRPRGPATGDNLGLCVFRDCMCDADCASPLVCIAGMAGSTCGYPAAGMTGTPCVGRDGGTDAARDTGTATDTGTTTDTGTATDAGVLADIGLPLG